MRPAARASQKLHRYAREARRRVGSVGRVQAAVAAVITVVLILAWLIGQAWVAARDNVASEAVLSGGEPSAIRRQEARVSSSTLTLSTNTLLQEGEVSASGAGFVPLETVVFRVKDPASGELRDLSRADADWRGGVPGRSTQLPDWLTSGTHVVEAIGEWSGNRANATLYVRAKSRWANLSSHGLKQAERFGFVVGGFEPMEKVNVYLAEGQDLQPQPGAAPVLTVDTDRAGNTAWTEMQVPLVKAGTYSLMWQGESGGGALSRNIVISALKPYVELSPWAGPPGSKVDLNGRGFVPGEEVGVYLGDATDPALTVTADKYGDLWAAGPATVPFEARGHFRVTLIGATSHALVTSSFSVIAPKPWVELSTYAGFAGTSVFFSGGGFAAGERLTVHVGSGTAPAIAVGHANEQGYYRVLGPVNVPPGATEEVTFVIVGENSHAQGQATFKVLIPWVPGARAPAG